MKIKKRTLLSNTQKMRGYVRTARGHWTEREGVVLMLEDEAGHLGVGEASPLPGYSSELLHASTQALATFALEDLPEIELGPDLLNQVERAGALLLQPSARCALEGALLDLLGQRVRQPLYQLLGGSESVRPLSVNALVRMDHSAEEMLAEAAAADARGIRSFKIKLGACLREMVQVASLRAAFPKHALRLDYNGCECSSDQEAEARLRSLVPLQPEWVEEPVPLLYLLRLTQGPVPIALDESLARPNIESVLTELCQRQLLGGLVLKPMALGWVRCLRLAHWAYAQGLRVVVTHLWDGPVGHALAAHLAWAIASYHPCLSERAMGLDAHPGLGAWSGWQCLPIVDGFIRVPTEPGLGLGYP